MQPKTDHPLARQEKLVVQEMPDEVLVYDLSQHKAHCLNQMAAFVWNHCDGQTSVAKIAELMEHEWHKPVSEDVVWLALRQLSKADLLQERLVKLGSEVNASRRALMRRFGFAAVTLPLVTSIVAPTALAGASVIPPPECQVCVKKQNGVGACPSVCTSAVTGRCYDNSGCGTGQALGCSSCVTCLSGGATRSWEAPGVPIC